MTAGRLPSLCLIVPTYDAFHTRLVQHQGLDTWKPSSIHQVWWRVRAQWS